MSNVVALNALLNATQGQSPRHQTEEALRAQLAQVDLYDLSGEKAAAEAMKRDDAFKAQQLEEKAQQTREFFAEQDRQQQNYRQEVQQKATQELEAQSQKEFWDQKQQQETQANMEKELQSLHAAATQAHQEFRTDFAQGVCRDDVAATYNADIDNRVGAYKARLDDLGANSLDSTAKADEYKVKLNDEVAPQIDAKAAELHDKHFPEQSSDAPKTDAPVGPGAVGAASGAADNPNKGFGPFEGAKPADFWPGGEAPRGSFWPGEVGAPPKDEPFFKNIDGSTPGVKDIPDGFMKEIKDIPDGFMKPIDEPLSGRLKELGAAGVEHAKEAGKEALEVGKKVGETGLEFGKMAAEHKAVDAALEHMTDATGVLDGVSGSDQLQIREMASNMRAHGMVGLKATMQNYATDAQAMAEQVGEKVSQAKEVVGEHLSNARDAISNTTKELGQAVSDYQKEVHDVGFAAGQALGAKVLAASDKAEAFVDSAKQNVQEFADSAKQNVQEFADSAKQNVQEFADSAKQKFNSAKTDAKDLATRFINDESGSASIEFATFGLAKSTDAALVNSFAERVKALNESPDKVQAYAASLKAMEPTAPAAAPTVAVEPAAPSAATPAAPAPVAPAPVASAPVAPAPVASAPAAPAPVAPAPAAPAPVVQPKPSIAPSL